MLRTCSRQLPMPDITVFGSTVELLLNASSNRAAREGGIVSGRKRRPYTSETRLVARAIVLNARHKRTSGVEYCLGFAHFRFCPNWFLVATGHAAATYCAHASGQLDAHGPFVWPCLWQLARGAAAAHFQCQRRGRPGAGQTGSARACHGPRRPRGHSVWPLALLLSRSQCGHYLPSLAGLISDLA